MERRRFISATGALGVSGLAGCLGWTEMNNVDDTGGAGDETDAGAADGGGDGDDEAGGSGDGTALVEHPAAADIETRPTLGTIDGNVIIAFEDPSCPRCKAFATETLPRVRSDLVEPGTAAFVARTYPVIYEWGKPATQALEAAYVRDEAAFWALSGFYYANQSGFDTGNVLERTASFLDEQTEFDGAAIASDAEAKAFDDRVQANLDAGEAAGAGRTTPSIFLFRDGVYQTKASGSISYEVIATALGVD